MTLIEDFGYFRLNWAIFTVSTLWNPTLSRSHSRFKPVPVLPESFSYILSVLNNLLIRSCRDISWNSIILLLWSKDETPRTCVADLLLKFEVSSSRLLSETEEWTPNERLCLKKGCFAKMSRKWQKKAKNSIFKKYPQSFGHPKAPKSPDMT